MNIITNERELAASIEEDLSNADNAVVRYLSCAEECPLSIKLKSEIQTHLSVAILTAMICPSENRNLIVRKTGRSATKIERKMRAIEGGA